MFTLSHRSSGHPRAIPLLDNIPVSVQEPEVLKRIGLGGSEYALVLKFLAKDLQLTLTAVASQLIKQTFYISPPAQKLVLASSVEPFVNNLFGGLYNNGLTDLLSSTEPSVRGMKVELEHNGESYSSFSVCDIRINHIWLLKASLGSARSSYRMHLEGDVSTLLVETFSDFNQLQIFDEIN